MASRKRGISKDEDMHALHKEWDEVSCPICMEHPHNAVLLLCSSYDKGCRSYICDTSYRHSNCLDRFRKLKAESGETPSSPSLSSRNQQDPDNTSSSNLGLSSSTELIGTPENHDVLQSVIATTMGLPGGAGGSRVHSVEDHMVERVGAEEANLENLSEAKFSLRCPLCRGSVLGWMVAEEARKYLNLKPRNCSQDSCSFIGNYMQLRQHARRVHPTARPADIHPSRQQAWQRLEDQREYADIVSAIHSAMPGSIVLGDYVIENGDRLPTERETLPGDDGRWTFFLFQMIGSMDHGAELRAGRSRALLRHRRSTGAFSRRRYLWGENLLGLQDEDSDDNGNDDVDDEEDDDEPDLNMLSDVGDDDLSLNPRRRRRLTQSRSDADQS